MKIINLLKFQHQGGFMEQYLSLYRANPLFDHIEEIALLPLLHCLQARKRDYAKGSVLFMAGESVNTLGILLSGNVYTSYADLMGNRCIISHMEPGQLFCDAFCATKSQRLLVDITAQTDCSVLLIDIDRILHLCDKACLQHQQLSENMIHILAEKYVSLVRKVIHLSAKKTRHKLLSYLSEQYRLAGGAFTIPFNQQELADYLFIERSGLSVEWNRLKNEGVLTQDGKLYTLHCTPCRGNDCSSLKKHSSPQQRAAHKDP